MSVGVEESWSWGDSYYRSPTHALILTPTGVAVR